MVWRIELIGEQFDLDKLAKVAQHPRFTVTKQEGMYFWISTSFNEAESVADVRSIATTLFPKLNSVGLMNDPLWRTVQLGNAVAQGIWEETKVVYTHERTVRQAAAISVVDENGNVVTDEGVPAACLVAMNALDSDQQLQKVLELFGREHTWSSLHNVLDAVEEAVGGEKKLHSLQFSKKSELERFTHTANNYQALGPEARHGYSKFAPPSNAMNLSEAKQVISTLVRSFVLHRGQANDSGN